MGFMRRQNQIDCEWKRTFVKVRKANIQRAEDGLTDCRVLVLAQFNYTWQQKGTTVGGIALIVWQMDYIIGRHFSLLQCLGHNGKTLGNGSADGGAGVLAEHLDTRRQFPLHTKLRGEEYGMESCKSHN
jgi:hypothetical protein